MFRKRPRRPKRPRVYRILVESYLAALAVVFALSVAISLLNQPKEIAYLPRHEFSVRDPAFVPSAHALANPSPVTGNRVDLLLNGDRIFPAMLAAIDAAKATVNLESYIFWSGEIASRFHQTWGEARGEVLAGDRFYPRLEPAGSTQAQVLSSTRRATSSATKLLYAVSIAAASERILLSNSYFVPDEGAVRLLAEAAGRGVDVRILVPGRVNDVPATKAAGKSGFGKLLKAGIRIYEYQPTMLHTKTMVVDGLFATVGSTNFDNRSLRLNEELNLTVYGAAFAKLMEESFWDDLKHSRPYSYREWTNRSLKERFLEWAIAPFRSQL